MENSDKDVQVESKSKATCEKKPQPRLINDQDEEGNNESSSETMTKKTINATRSEADAALEKQSDVKESEDKNITSNVVKENINKSNKKVEKMYSVLVDNYTMSDVSETIHYANAAVLDGNENIKCATLSPVCVLPITEDNAYYEPVISKSDDCKSSDKNNNIEVSCNLTNFTNISSLQEDEPEICEELGHIYDSRNEYSNSTIHGISGSDKLLGLGLASKSVESGQKDHRNNTAIRLESVHTPKGDGISSPEVFRLTHLSPTLYGYETSLMMTKPNQTSFSRAGSTLNTPELQCVEDLDHRDIFTSHSASSTLSCDQKKRKLSSYDYFQEENENPLHFETSDLQPNFVSDQKYPKSTYIDSTNYINNAYTQHTFSQSLDLKANQSYQSISRPSCKYPGWNANQTMDATNSRLKSHTACRLDFESPVYLSCLSDIESSVDFKHCKNWSQNYGVNNFSAPPFISNKVCLSDNLTRPQPIIPTVSSYQHYPGMNTSYDLDTSSQALLYPSIPIVAMQNACLKTSSSGVSTSETHTSPLQPTYQYRQDVDHSASHISSLYTAVSPVATSFTSTSITNSTYNCDQNENDIHRPRGNIRSSATFSRQNISMSYQNESPAVIATPLDRINNNTDTEKVLANVNFADVDVARIQVNNSINCHLIPETGKTLMGLTNSCDKMGIVNVPDIPQDIASHTNTSGNIMDSSDLDNYKPTDDMVLPIKVKNKNVSITVSELRSKTVRQLYEKAKVNESDEDNYNIEVSRRKKVQCNRAFIARYEKEKRTRSPISAFCAALNVKEPPKTKPILPAIAEPRIPIETLLSQNEVPMVHDGSMLVPYFNPSMQHTLHYTAHASSVVQSRLKLQHPRYKNISNVKMTQTQCPNQLPLTMAVPLYANPVPENNILQAVPAQQPLTNILDVEGLAAWSIKSRRAIPRSLQYQ